MARERSAFVPVLMPRSAKELDILLHHPPVGVPGEPPLFRATMAPYRSKPASDWPTERGWDA